MERRRRAGLRLPLRLRAVRLSQRGGAFRARHRALLLPAQDAEPPRGASVERRLSSSPRRRSRFPRGTIRATVLIETLPGRVRDGGDPVGAPGARQRVERRTLGLSLLDDQDAARERATWRLPDRAQVTMTVPVHARVHGSPGQDLPSAWQPTPWAAWRPSSPAERTPQVNEAALAKVPRGQAAGGGRRLRRHLGRASGPRAGGARGLRDGARRPGQPEGSPARRGLRRPPASSSMSRVPGGEPSPRPGFRLNVNVALQYLNSWLTGNGAAAIFNLMEDVATAEISRSQLWQWIHAARELSDGRPATLELYRTIRDEELARLGRPGDGASAGGGGDPGRTGRVPRLRRVPHVSGLRLPGVEAGR